MQNKLNKYKVALPGKAKAKEENIQKSIQASVVLFSVVLCFFIDRKSKLYSLLIFRRVCLFLNILFSSEVLSVLYHE